MYAEVSADDEDVVRLCNKFNFKWSSKTKIKEAVLQKLWAGNEDDYMCMYCYLFTYFLSYTCTFLIIYLSRRRK